MTRRTDQYGAVFYRRANTRQQADSGVGPYAQRTKLRREAEHREWTIVADLHDVASGKRTNGQAGLEHVLAMLKRDQADVLVVSKLDRLRRSVADFARLMEQARRGALGGRCPGLNTHHDCD